jgi:hypothetical protein
MIWTSTGSSPSCWTDGTDRNLRYVYELDPATKSYGLTGIFHDRLKTTAPFDIEIDLTAVGRRRSTSGDAARG